MELSPRSALAFYAFSLLALGYSGYQLLEPEAHAQAANCCHYASMCVNPDGPYYDCTEPNSSCSSGYACYP